MSIGPIHHRCDGKFARLLDAHATLFTIVEVEEALLAQKISFVAYLNQLVGLCVNLSTEVVMQDQRNEQSETLSKTEARQGQRGFSTRVLAISLVVVVVAFAGIYIYAESNDREDPSVVGTPSLESVQSD